MTSSSLVLTLIIPAAVFIAVLTSLSILGSLMDVYFWMICGSRVKGRGPGGGREGGGFAAEGRGEGKMAGGRREGKMAGSLGPSNVTAI